MLLTYEQIQAIQHKMGIVLPSDPFWSHLSEEGKLLQEASASYTVAVIKATAVELSK